MFSRGSLALKLEAIFQIQAEANKKEAGQLYHKGSSKVSPTLAEPIKAIDTREEVNVSSTIELTLDDPNRVIEGIMPDILKMALEHQKGRGIDEYAQGHNFTERWFRVRLNHFRRHRRKC